MTIQAARALVDAITTRDFGALEEALAPDARMRALLPAELTERRGSKEIAAQIEGWFGGAEPFEVLSATVEPLPDKFAITYRFRLTRPAAERETVIEQHLFAVAPNGKVETIDLVCSGFRPLESIPAGAIHDFDAGDLGCADGLTVEFRNRIKGIGVGDLLRVHTVDPSAKEDLPSLARLMGHVVRSVEADTDGGLTITMERGR